MPTKYRISRFILILILASTWGTAVNLTQDVSPTETPVEDIIASPTSTSTVIPTEIATEVSANIATEIPIELPTSIPSVSPTDLPAITPTDLPGEIAIEESPVIDVISETTPEIIIEVSAEATSEVTAIPEIVLVTVESSPIPHIAQIPAEPEMSLVVRESFNNGDLSPWMLTPAWSLVPDEDGLALQVLNSLDSLVLNKGEFLDVAVQASFLLHTGQAQISLRKSQAGEYTVALDASGQVSLFKNGESLQSALATLDTVNQWHRLRLSAVGGMLRVTVDGTEVIALVDASPLPPGGMALAHNFVLAEDASAVSENILLADDFLLWVPSSSINLYPAPTAVVQNPDIATEPPTPVPTEIPLIENIATVNVQASVVTKDISPFPPPDPELVLQAVAPSNNNFASALTLSSLPYNNSGDSTAATLQTGESTPTCGINISNTVWYRFTPSVTSDYMLSTAGSDFDTIVSVYTGSAVNALTQLACNDDATTTTFSSQLGVQLSSSTTYYIQLGGYNGRYGNFVFNLQQIGLPIPDDAPSLSNPSNGTFTNNSSNPLPALTWLSVSDAHHYEVQIDDDKKFGSPDQVGSNIVGLSYTVNPALPDSEKMTYYWRVRGLNINNQAGPWSKALSFIIDTVAPSLPILKSPNDGSVTSKTQEKFGWTGSKDTDVYLVDLDNNSNFSSPVYLNSPATKQFVPPTSLPQDLYYWRVQAEDDAGNISAESAVRSLTVNIVTSPKTDSIFFTKGSATTAKVSLKWAKVNGASNYLLYLYTNAGCSALLSGYPVDMGSSSNTSVNLGHGQYCMKVRAAGVDGGIPPISTQFIVSPPALPTPKLVSLPDKSSTNDTTPTLDWDAVTSADKYELEWSTDSQFRTILGSALINNPATAYTLPALPGTPGVRYYWRVGANSDLGVAGAMSKPFSFSINILLEPDDAQTFFLKSGASSTDVTMKWAGVSGATNYMLYLYSNLACSSLVSGYPMDMGSTLNHSESLGQGQYCWKVQAVGVDAGIPTLFNTFAVSSPALNPPTLVSPSNGALTNDTTPTLDWDAVTDAAKYGVEWSSDSKFKTILGSTVVNAPTSAYTLPALPSSDGKRYYWRVNSINSLGVGGNFSKAFGFMLDNVAPSAPDLKSPSDGSIITNPQPKLSWQTIKGSNSYLVDVDDNSNFSSPLYLNIPVSKQFVPPTPLPQGLYYWQVQSQDPTGNTSGESEKWSFTVNILTSPKDGSAIFTKGSSTSANVSLKWAKVKSATGYSLYLYSNLTCTTLVSGYPQNVGTSVSQSVVLEQGQYCWKVQAIGVDTGVPPVFNTFIVSPPALASPKLLSPIDKSATNDTTPTLDWDAVSDADKYQIEWTSDKTFKSILGLQIVTHPTTAYTLPALTSTNGTTYYWRVGTMNDLGVVGSMSKPFTFTLDTVAPSAPELLSPADESVTTSNPPTFSWKKVNGAVSYEIAYGLVDPPAISETTSSTSFKPPSPLLLKTYLWRVRVVDLAGNVSDWSNAGDLWQVKIVSVSLAASVLNRYAISNPEPMNLPPTFCWGPISWAMGYELQVDDNLNFSSLVYSNDSIASDAQCITVDPLTDGTWYWRIRALRADANNTMWSPVSTFTVET